MSSQTAEEQVERLLYSLTALADIGEATTAGGNSETTARELLHLILGTLAVSKGAILRYDTLEKQLRVTVCRGVDSPETLTLPLSRELAKALCECSDPIRLNEPDAKLAPYVEQHREALAALHAEVWTPMIVGRQLVGILSLSGKFAKQPYTADDLQLLSTMAQHASLALYNFQIIDEIRHANFKLNRKVLEMQSLYDVGLAISLLRGVKELAQEIVQRAVMLLDASQGVLFLLERNCLRVTASFGMEVDYEEDALIPLDRVHPPEISEVVIAQSCSCILNERGSGIPDAKNCLIMPLIVAQKTVGVLMVCDKETRDGGFAEFTEDDEQFLSAIATQAAIAIDNARLHKESLEKERIEKELEVAAAIQQRLLPQCPPVFDAVETVGVNISCRQVGGDYYDYIRFDERRLGLVIADVSGKGTPAALLVSTLQASFHALVESYDLAETVTRLNKAIYKASPSYNYITFFYGILDLDAGCFRSINAGHNDPLMLRADGTWHRFESGGFCLGMFDWGTYEAQETSLKSGDLMFLYTDGVTESTNLAGEEFGEDRAREVLEEYRNEPLTVISQKLSEAIAEFVGEAPQHDDLTYVLLRFK